MRAALLGNEEAGDLALQARGDQNRARLSQRLHPGRDVDALKISPAASTTAGPKRATSSGLPTPRSVL
jgi:hypothetical protein